MKMPPLSLWLLEEKNNDEETEVNIFGSKQGYSSDCRMWPAKRITTNTRLQHIPNTFAQIMPLTKDLLGVVAILSGVDNHILNRLWR
ncbi:uncharacterized protein [Euphorbia lathyris]|uniref:uncharacterized protein isoform X2 n=1 Tax=Euphorbia lathyris TaxID=212925 RepID=UPI0033135F8B